MDLWQGQDLKTMNERQWQALSYSQTPNKPLSKVWALADAIREIQADLLLLNEVGGAESLKNFVHHFLGDSYQGLWQESNSDRGIDLAYLLRIDSPLSGLLLSHRRRPLDYKFPNDLSRLHYFSRDCLELRLFEPRQALPQLVVLLVHLKSRRDSVRGDPAGFSRRRAEFELLLKIYREIRLELPGTPVIVGGDFNGQLRRGLLDREFHSLYEETDLMDVFDVIQRPPEHCATQVQIQRSRPPLLLQLDHILISPELRDRVDSQGTYVYMYKSDMGVAMPYSSTLEQRDQLPSDHYPVVVSFESLTSS